MGNNGSQVGDFLSMINQIQAGQPTQPQFGVGGGGWGSQGNVWSPFSQWSSPYTQAGGQVNATPYNFTAPSVTSPYMWNQFSQDPLTVINAYSPAAFQQFPYFYGGGNQANAFQNWQNPWSAYAGAIPSLGGGGGQTAAAAQTPAQSQQAATQATNNSLGLTQDQLAQLQQLLAPREFSPASPPDN